MKRYNRFAARPRKRYLVVVVMTLAPLLWSFAEHGPDTEAAADSALAARPGFEAGPGPRDADGLRRGARPAHPATRLAGVTDTRHALGRAGRVQDAQVPRLPEE